MAMVRPALDKLYGTIEVDETFIGEERTDASFENLVFNLPTLIL
jgi:hypothetical protein